MNADVKINTHQARRPFVVCADAIQGMVSAGYEGVCNSLRTRKRQNILLSHSVSLPLRGRGRRRAPEHNPHLKNAVCVCISHDCDLRYTRAARVISAEVQ